VAEDINSEPQVNKKRKVDTARNSPGLVKSIKEVSRTANGGKNRLSKDCKEIVGQNIEGVTDAEPSLTLCEPRDGLNTAKRSNQTNLQHAPSEQLKRYILPPSASLLGYWRQLRAGSDSTGLTYTDYQSEKGHFRLACITEGNAILFAEWIWLCHTGFNVLCYGIGCKQGLFRRFARDCLSGEDVIEINIADETTDASARNVLKLRSPEAILHSLIRSILSIVDSKKKLFGLLSSGSSATMESDIADNINDEAFDWESHGFDAVGFAKYAIGIRHCM
jgi:hypothetical protein